MLWLAAPAGTGKTVLASGYLESRGLPHIWYQVDEGDGDPASFFHYLGLAAREFSASRFPPLPSLTPEYLPNLGLFGRRFFEQLYRRLEAPTILVLDNYHEAPEASLLHEIVRDAGTLLPPGLNLIVVSRAEPPPAFARARLHGDLTVIGFDELRLTLDEAQALARMRKADTADAPDFVERCHALAQGWTAGMILLLEQARINPGEPPRMDAPSRNLLFDYFVGEIFGSLSAAARMVLLQTAVLPKMRLPWVDALTGSAEAGRMLMDLHRRDFFVLRREEPDAAFEYHPLFRDFLLAEARKTLGTDIFAELLRRAAAILAGTGQAEDAVPLYLETGDFDALAALLPSLAPALLAQGRHQTLEQWLAAIPEAAPQSQSWQRYWLGHARLPQNLREGRSHFEDAFARFDLEDDATGLYLSWAAIVNSYFLEWSDFSGLDRWIDAYEHLRRRHAALPVAEGRAAVYSALVSFVYRQPQHPGLPAWAEQARALLESGEAGVQSMPLAATLQNYYVWMGDLTGAAAVVDHMNALTAGPEVPPLAFILTKAMSAVYHWKRSELPACLEQVREGLKRAEENGIHAWDFWLNAQGAYGGLIGGDPRLAEDFLGKAQPAIQSQQHLGAAHYHFLMGLVALQRGDIAKAMDQTESSLSMTTQAGMPFSQALSHVCLALPLFRLGRDAEAAGHLDRCRQLTARMGSKAIEYLCLLTESRVALERHEQSRGLAALARALAISRECGGLVMGWWGPEAMARLYAAALESGIETAYVRELIRRMGLTPPDPLEAPEDWPWPVEIHALGRFEIVKDGQPLRFAGKAQQKPLELLMSLVAHGGTEVPWALLADDLWPDAEGDAGYRALVTTVQRLRKLLDHPEAIRFGEGAVSLDPRRVGVDAWCFERLLEQAGAALRDTGRGMEPPGHKRMLALYRGPFLDRVEAPWAIATRERLRSRHASYTRNLGRGLESLGKEREAAELYRKSIEADPSVEVFHQHLIYLRLRQGRVCEARAAYEHCRKVFAAQFGKSPSRETDNMIRPHL